MNLFTEQDIEYPFTVAVWRSSGGYDGAGNYRETRETVIASMTADIQLSLKIRNLVRETKTGTADTALYLMFCQPPCPIVAGDTVIEGERAFSVESVHDWGSHTECVLARCEHPLPVTP